MRCAIDVRIEPEGPIPVGADVRVRVTATADAAAACRGIRCEALWEATPLRAMSSQTIGPAIVMQLGLFRRPLQTRVLDRLAPGGEIGPGGPFGVAFQVAVPAQGPVTYHGLFFKVEWGLRVSLDMAWREDPVQTTTLVVVPRTE